MRLIVLMFCAVALLFGKVGVVSALSGDAKVQRESGELEASVGFEIEEKDAIFTSANATMQILFDDDTVITIGRDSEFKVEEFLFDESQNSNAKFASSKGFFKAITGKVGKVSPDKFNIKTKNATIGIRGTHILANISDSSEKIACTQGAISVEAGGKIVEVKAGEITTLSATGIPDIPRELTPGDYGEFDSALSSNSVAPRSIDVANLVQRISSVKLDPTTLRPNAQELQSLFDEINALSNSKDEQVELLDILEDSLNTQLDEYYRENFFQTPALSYKNLFNLKFGYFTQSEVAQSGSKYVVDGLEYGSLSDAITQAKPEEFYRYKTKITDASKIASFMGMDGEVSLSPWDGRGGDRKGFSYIGKSIGFYSDGEKNSAILDNENNEVYLFFDYGNRRVVGYVNFDAINSTTGEVEPYRLAVISAGPEVINPTSFYSEDFLAMPDSAPIDWMYSFYSRFHGDSADEISTYFETLPQGSGNILGLMVASKGDAIDIKKHLALKDDSFEWGYWGDAKFVAQNGASGVYGGWIKPNVDDTPSSIIDEYITQGIKASYSGGVIGSVHKYLGDSALIDGGVVELNFDFQKNTLDGYLGFEADKELWSLDITSGKINKNEFLVDGVKGSFDSTKNIISGNIDGKFFGANAQSVGGGFNLISSDGDMALGAFGATKR